MKKVAIIQARISSTRLPAKVMLDLSGKTILERVVERVKLSSLVDEIWIATSDEREDDVIEELAKKIHISCYRGSLSNVLTRYYQASKQAKADIIIRITADNPLTDPSLIDTSIMEIMKKRCDYVGFSKIPVGTGVEAFTFKSLESIIGESGLLAHHYEHVTPYYYENPNRFNIFIKKDFYLDDLSDLRVTVDTLADYIYLSEIFNRLIEDAVNPKEFIEYLISRGSYER